MSRICRPACSGQPSAAIAGPTIRALLAAGASPTAVKQAAHRLVELARAPTADMFGDWSLLEVYGGIFGSTYERHYRSNMDWKRGMGGFVVRDAKGRLVGMESVRFEGASAQELLLRLWVGYAAEAKLRDDSFKKHKRDPAVVAAAIAPPADDLSSAFRRIAEHDADFRMPPGFDATQGWRVSSLEIVVAGLHFQALEVAGNPVVISGMSGPAPVSADR